MAKALIGYMNSDLRSPALAAENARLRARVGELEALARACPRRTTGWPRRTPPPSLEIETSHAAGDAARLSAAG